MSARPNLRALAARLGIANGYTSALDQRWVETRDSTREALVHALGHPAEDERRAAESLAALDAAARRTPLARERVVTWNHPDAARLPVRWPAEAPARARYELEAVDPEGGVERAGGEIERGAPLPWSGPSGPGLGRVRLRLGWPGGEANAEQTLYAVPERCIGLDERLGDRGAFGLWTSLYLLRSDRNFGFGNFADLESLLDWAAREGAAFVGLNPLHALASPPRSPCPYLPQSRLFREPLYLDPLRTPEWDASPQTRRLADAAAGPLAALRSAERLDVGAVEAALRPIWRALHHTFVRDAQRGASERGRAFDRFVSGQGRALEDFVTFRALAEDRVARGLSDDAGDWPAEWRDPRSAAVEAFRRSHADALAFHRWIQFELDRQLGGLADRARKLGMPIGLYTDLALGSHAGGSDVWANGALFARGVTVGAPPDAFSQAGQDWSFPPLDPTRLEDGGYGFWWRLVDGALAHAGALRLDHALCLRRLFWIPEGAPPAEGAYVHYPETALLGLLALASRRRDALVIGEDLGTIPEGFAESLSAYGVLSSRVLLFERDGEGFHPAARLPRSCLVTANTHDLPPLAALLSDEDLALRRRAGQLPDDEAWRGALASREDDRRALGGRLAHDAGLAAPLEPGPEGEAALAASVSRFLCSSPAGLVGISVDDLAGEREPVNLPGVPPERHPSWTRRCRWPIERIARSELARSALDAVPPSRRSPTSRRPPPESPPGPGRSK